MLILKRFHLIFSIVGQLVIVFLFCVACSYHNLTVAAQDAGFELPVQLIGFPVIVLAVRTSNFVRKLAYAINPSTYRRSIRKVRRGVDSSKGKLDLAKADKELFNHLGPNYCVHENICLRHVQSGIIGTAEDWAEIIKYA